MTGLQIWTMVCSTLPYSHLSFRVMRSRTCRSTYRLIEFKEFDLVRPDSLFKFEDLCVKGRCLTCRFSTGNMIAGWHGWLPLVQWCVGGDSAWRHGAINRRWYGRDGVESGVRVEYLTELTSLRPS